MTEIACIVLAAGQGTRMKSSQPKVMHRVAGTPMVGHVVRTAEALGPQRIVVVVGPAMEGVAAAVAPHPTVLQADRLGTGHAVSMAREHLQDFAGTVLVLYGDTPLVRPETLRRLAAALERPERPAVAVLGMRPSDPGAYGRLVTAGEGALEAIVEAADATPEQRRIGLVNAGFMVVDGRRLFELLDRVGNANSKGEYYLTDLVAVARAAGLPCAYVEGEEEDALGVNSRAELAVAEGLMQRRLRAAAMAGGATLIDPASVFLSLDTVLGRDVVVEANVVFGPGVRVADDVEIRAFSHLEGVTIAAGARIGPFARLRPGAEIGRDAHIGNFVEVKNATVEDGAKVNHLSYIGDARVGAKANIGAGTITCNYDGFLKHRTDIGAGAFIGSNTALVAPVSVGDGAIIGAGSTVTRDVPADAIAVVRGETTTRPGMAKIFRERKAALKAAKSKG